MKITSVTPYHNVAIRGTRAGHTNRIHPDAPEWKGWSFSVRGPSVFVVSPPGYKPGGPAEGNKRYVAVIPLSQCQVEFELEENEGIEAFNAPPQTKAPDVRLDSPKSKGDKQ